MKNACITAIALGSLSMMNTAQAQDPISASAATAFVNQQFHDYFTNCNAFASSFATPPTRNTVLWSEAAGNPHLFKYCDGGPCLHDANSLLQVCQQTEGSFNDIVELKVLPSSSPDPFNPSYDHVAIKGLQTVVLTFEAGYSVPLCFDFAITEDLAMRKGKLQSTSWIGYYNVSFGTCR